MSGDYSDSYPHVYNNLVCTWYTADDCSYYYNNSRVYTVGQDITLDIEYNSTCSSGEHCECYLFDSPDKLNCSISPYDESNPILTATATIPGASVTAGTLTIECTLLIASTQVTGTISVTGSE